MSCESAASSAKSRPIIENTPAKLQKNYNIEKEFAKKVTKRTDFLLISSTSDANLRKKCSKMCYCRKIFVNLRSNSLITQKNMKLKNLFVVLLMSVTSTTFAQVDKQLLLADQLVRYGHQKQSALSLIQAYKIYADLNVIDAQDSNVSQTESLYNRDRLLADAKKYAGDDGVLLALIDEVKNSVRAGAIAGPKRFYESVSAGGTKSHKIQFTKGTYSYVVVSGDSEVDYTTDEDGIRTRQEANLQLGIYNSRGQSLSSDKSLGTNCLASLIPHTSGVLTVEVKNTGSRGCNYVMYVYNE